MPGIRNTGRGVLAALLTSGLVAGLIVGAAPVAHGVFPGTNGPVVWTTLADPADVNVLDPTTGINTVICSACADGFFSPAVSRDGQTVAFTQTGPGPLALISIHGG